MPIEMYRVEEDKAGRLIHYHGYTWECGAVEMTWCCVPLQDIDGEAYERVMEASERVTQYFVDLDERGILEYESGWKGEATFLRMCDVSEDTACGSYWCELCDAVQDE